MSCLLSKFCSVRSPVQLRKLSIPAHSLFARRAFNQPLRYPAGFQNSLLYPTLFTLSVSSGAIVIAAIVQYERHITSTKHLLNFQEYFKITQNQGIISNLKKRWNGLQPSQKIFSAILLLNTLVFLAWQVPRWEHIMIKYFMTDGCARNIPLSSLLLSAFSHSSPVHLGFNMLALHSFCLAVIQPWQMGPEEFTAMYISACVVSSLASIVFRRSFRKPGNSLGASGAILAVVGYFALSHPDEKLSVIFIPNVQFDAIYGLIGLISMDTLGLILQWQVFDHAAHLGGTLFGMFWYSWVSKHLWSNRKHIVKYWIKLKQSIHQTKR